MRVTLDEIKISLPRATQTTKIPKNTLNMKGMRLCKENNKLLLSSIGQNT